jgi:hypothetical protein
MRKRDYDAMFTIYDAANMTPAQIKRTVYWLRHNAKSLTKEGKNYSKRFTARLMKGV